MLFHIDTVRLVIGTLIFLQAPDCSVIPLEKSLPSNPGSYVEDGQEHPCSQVQSAYHVKLCDCEEHRDAVIACIPGTHVGECRDFHKGIEECERRSSAKRPTSSSSSHAGENGTTASPVNGSTSNNTLAVEQVTSSTLSNESLPWSTADVSIRPTENLTNASSQLPPYDTVVTGTSSKAWICGIVILYALAWVVAVWYIRRKLKDIRINRYAAVSTG